MPKYIILVVMHNIIYIGRFLTSANLRRIFDPDFFIVLTDLRLPHRRNLRLQLITLFSHPQSQDRKLRLSFSRGINDQRNLSQFISEFEAKISIM